VATYQFSALADGQAVSFNPNADRLNFDQSAIAAADIRVTAVGSNLLVTYVTTGKEITLLNTAVNQLASTNFTLSSASLALFGDNSPGTASDGGSNVLTGGDGRDLLMGLGGNDTLGGGAGSDVLIGGSGNDSIGGGSSGDDWLEGGAGVDRLAGGSGKDSFVFREAGTANADTVTDFVTNWDSIQLGGDTLTGLGASGRFASGDVRFHSGAGVTAAHDVDDRIIYNTTTGQLFYDADGIGGASAQLLANLGAGRALTASDFVVFATSSSSGPINGTPGNDSLVGGAGNDSINGLGGNDTLIGNGGNDTLDGGTGADSMDGGGGQDTYLVDSNSDSTADSGTDSAADLVISTVSSLLLAAEIENVTLGAGALSATGNASANVMTGNSLDNFFDGAGGNDTLNGADGNDTLWGGSGNESIVGGLGSDNLSGDDGNDVLDGGDGNDALGGGGGNDTLRGGAGDDVMVLGATAFGGTVAGVDSFDGGAGFDRLVVGAVASGVTIHVSAGTIVTSEGTSTFVNVEHVTGSDFGDEINGYNDANALDGAGGNDTIHGAGGNDTLWGFSGTDTLIGSLGNDVLYGDVGDPELEPEVDHFVFNVLAGAADADLVMDFVSGVDRIHLEAGAMPNLGLSGSFSAGDARFFAGAGATAGHDADDRVIFNTSTGALYHDADGNGAGAALLIATLQAGATLAATDITVDNGERPPGPVINGTAGDDELVGTQADETINGFAGNDYLDGREGDDSLLGGDGDDVLQSGGGWADGFGHDAVDGGAGFDILTFDDRPGGIVADMRTGSVTSAWGAVTFTNVEEVYGSADDDHITAHDGGADIRGGAGHDTLIGGNGNDFLSGDGPDSSGRARVYGMGNDSIAGGAGDDWISQAFGFGEPEPGNDTIDGGTGVDLIEYDWLVSDLVIDLAAGTITGGGWDGAGHATVTNVESILIHGTGTTNDRLVGNSVANNLAAGAGSDTLAGGAGNDTLSGGAGGDTFILDVAPGSANFDVITEFTSGADRIRLDANAHANLGFGGDFSAGDARFAANATGTAQDGSDRVVYNTSNGQLWYDADGNGAGVAQLLATLTAAPTLAATDFVVDNGSVPGGSVINGTAGNDTLSGTAGNDTVSGLGGNDTYLAGGTYGADVFDGGAGFDSIEFKAGATNAIMVDYNVGFISGGGTGSISFTSVERVVGGNFADTLNGDAVAQNLTGQGGNDTLAGGAGVDTLWGGFGSDAFVFREAGSANADRLNDFATGEDRIHLDDAFFTNIGAPGQFADGDQRFRVGAGVNSGHDADDRLVFNTSTGQLYYDADGSGAGAAQLVATILNGVMPWATDFVVI